MKIINLSKKREICSNAKYLSSFFSKVLGLMFSKQKNIIFDFFKEQKISLHMWFVFYPIDVIFLDSNKKVVFVKNNFKPFTFFSCPVKCQYVLELKNGFGNKIDTGDKIDFKK